MHFKYNKYGHSGSLFGVCNQPMDITQDYNLHQMATCPIRENNILDLGFTNVSFHVRNVSILPGLAYHDIASVVSPVRIKQTSRIV